MAPADGKTAALPYSWAGNLLFAGRFDILPVLQYIRVGQSDRNDHQPLMLSGMTAFRSVFVNPRTPPAYSAPIYTIVSSLESGGVSSIADSRNICLL